MPQDQLIDTRSQTQTPLPRTILVVLMLGAFSGIGASGYQALMVNPADVMPNLLSALGIAMMFTVVLERAVDVLLSVLYGPQEIREEMERTAVTKSRNDAIEREQALLGALKTPEERLAFLSETGSGVSVSALAGESLATIRQNNQPAISRKIRKHYTSVIALMLLGGALAAGGFRILSQVFSPDMIADRPMLVYVDIVVTTLVLGGGAQGVHEVITKLKNG